MDQYSEFIEEETIDRCAIEILNYIIQIGFPWFDKWRDDYSLFNNEDSPLDKNIRSKYENNKVIDYLVCQNSYRLLGIKVKK